MRKKCLIVGWGERRTLAVLGRALNDRPFRLWAKPRLKDVIDVQPRETVSVADYGFLLKSHLDFVACDASSEPLFAVEFDGPQHQEGPQRALDIRKNRLCTKAGLPLLRIRGPELQEYEQTTVLEFIVHRFIAWGREAAGFRECADPSFEFDLSHPFPGLLSVSERLLLHYKMRTQFLPVRSVMGWLPLSCDIESQGDFRSGALEASRVGRYALYRLAPGITRIEVWHGRMATPGVHLLAEGTVRFGMQWMLPVAEDYHSNRESPFEYFRRTGKKAATFIELPGVSIPDVTESVSEYLALREVEKWAARNLPPAA